MIRRALFFVPDLLGGGAQRTMLNLAAAMPRDRWQVELALGGPDGPARAWIDAALPTHALGADRLRDALWPLTRLIRARKPHVVLSTMLDANVVAYAAKRLSRVKCGLALRETNSQRARTDLGRARLRLARFAYRRADCVIALSEGVRRELVADLALDPARTVTIGNPVAVASIAVAAEAARRNPPPWMGTSLRAAPTVVAIGRLHRQKGFDVLLEAFAVHAPAAAQLIILGEGELRADLGAQAARLGIAARVALPGFVADPIAYLAHADAFVLSSRWEGFGHVLIEAMAAQTPVIATDCPHGPADFMHHDENGLLVPTEDAERLGAALARVLTDSALADRLAAAGVLTAQRYEAARIAEIYADTLSKIARASN